VPPDAVQALAAQRAQVVRAALARAGVDPSRLAIAEPAAVQAQAEGVPTALSLGASAG